LCLFYPIPFYPIPSPGVGGVGGVGASPGLAVVTAEEAHVLVASWPLEVRRLVAACLAISACDGPAPPIALGAARRAMVRPLLASGLLAESPSPEPGPAASSLAGPALDELFGLRPTARLWGTALAYLGGEAWDGADALDPARRACLARAFVDVGPDDVPVPPAPAPGDEGDAGDGPNPPDADDDGEDEGEVLGHGAFGHPIVAGAAEVAVALVVVAPPCPHCAQAHRSTWSTTGATAGSGAVCPRIAPSPRGR